jgi:hypothetical protein
MPLFKKVLPMSPVHGVTYVSGRTIVLPERELTLYTGDIGDTFSGITAKRKLPNAKGIELFYGGRSRIEPSWFSVGQTACRFE